MFMTKYIVCACDPHTRKYRVVYETEDRLEALQWIRRNKNRFLRERLVFVRKGHIPIMEVSEWRT